MKKFFILIFFSLPALLGAQYNLYVPIEFQKAFENGTRSTNGNPGSVYWQNHSEYKIDAEFITATRTLKGTETITYYNESPDDLRNLVVRLYQNISRPESAKDWDYNPGSFTNGVTLNKIKVNGQEINIERATEHTATNLQINYSLSSKSKIELYFDWSFQLPRGQSPRMGRYDSTTYLIAYWYPQMAVYDDIDSWDNIDYRGQVEFYNDFSDYDVNISTDNPKSIVWATGELQNPEEVFTNKYASVYKAKSENKIINFINSENKNEDILNKTNKLKWHYKASKVPDFVFSFSDHYYWDFTDLIVEPDRTVRINTAYNPESKGFEIICGVARDAIKYFSTEIPGVPFPYPSMTVFNGAGGMEFPMMVNDGKADDYSSDIYLTSHETFHTYFPFYMGTNERKYAWMDEGLTVFLPQEFQTKNSKDTDWRKKFVKRYSDFSGTLYDVPLMMLSHQLKSPSYRYASYHKAACAYDILKDILGEKIFSKCLKEYIKRWNGKHPTPYDFFNTFKDVSGENLDWFFKPWYFEFGYPDLGISSVRTESGKLKITVEKIGNYPVPIYLVIKKDNNENIEIYESAKIWSNGVTKITFEKQAEDNMISIELGNKYIPDINNANNIYNLK
jgi:hypothetical protein